MSKRTTEKVKVKFHKKDGTPVEIDAIRITTKPVKIRFRKKCSSRKEDESNE